MSWFHIPALLEISKDDPLLRQHLIGAEAKGFELVFENLYKGHSVLCVDEAIMEHSHDLMVPQLGDAQGIITKLSRATTNPLEHLVDVSEVEGVVRFLGRR